MGDRAHRGPRVVLVAETFPVRSETFIVRQFLGLLDAGVDVWLVCHRRVRADEARFPDLVSHPDALERVVESGIGRNPVAVARATGQLVATLVRRPGAVFTALRVLVRRGGRSAPREALLAAPLLALDPDLVHVEFGSHAVARLHLPAALGCPMSVSFRGFDLNYVGLDEPDHYRELWSTIAGVHCLGVDLWRRALDRGCPPDMPHVLVAPAVDAAYFDPGVRDRPAITADRPLRVLTVARLQWKKGLPDGLAAVRAAIDRGVAVDHRIVGTGDARDEVEATIRDLGLGRVVTLAGEATRAEVREHLRWADVLLHPAVSEGFCNAVLEAQSMAVPVVCTDADGLAENVLDGATGFVVTRRDPDAMAAKLELLAGDPALRERLGGAGRERASTSFTLGREVAGFRAFFDDLVAEAGRQA